MKRLAILLLALPMAANAELISFEGLVSETAEGFSQLGISNTYQGYRWSPNNIILDWGVVDCLATTCFGDQTLTAVTGTSYAYTFGGPQSLFIDFGESTDVADAYFAGQFANRGGFNSNTIQVFGFDSLGNLIATTSVFDLVDSQWQLLSIGFTDVYSIEFRSDRTNSWFAIDDLRVNEVPEPGTLALFAIGLAGIGLARRRRTQ